MLNVLFSESLQVNLPPDLLQQPTVRKTVSSLAIKGAAQQWPGEEVRGQDTWGVGGASCSPVTLSAPHLSPDLEVSQGPVL